VESSPFEFDGRYHYNFLPSGFFTLLNHKGEPYYEVARILVERLVSHLVWIFCWVVLILTIHFFNFEKLIYFSDRFFTALIIANLFLFGCRLTTLLLRGGIRPVLFPPLWIRLTRRMQKGGGLEVLKRHDLQEHPGLLANLAIAELSRKDCKSAKLTLREALKFCPYHAALLELEGALNSIDLADKEYKPKAPDDVANGCESGYEQQGYRRE